MAKAPKTTDTSESAGDASAPDEPSVFAQGSMIAERIYIVTAPGGPRRRAGFGFGPEPVELTTDDLGDDPDAVIEAIRADPKLKLDGRYEERPFDPATDSDA